VANTDNKKKRMYKDYLNDSPICEEKARRLREKNKKGDATISPSKDNEIRSNLLLFYIEFNGLLFFTSLNGLYCFILN